MLHLWVTLSTELCRYADISPRMPPSTWRLFAAKDSRCGWMTSLMVPKSMSSEVENIELKSKEKITRTN